MTRAQKLANVKYKTPVVLINDKVTFMRTA